MKYAVIDVETTGLDPQGNRVIDIGIVLLDADLAQESFFTSLVNPQMPVTATDIHRICDADVTSAPAFTWLIPQVVQLLDQRIIVAHNVPFDLRFLNAESSRSGQPLNLERHHAVCTMDQSRIYCPEGSHSLGGLASRLGIETPVLHRALPDALICAELFRHYVNAESQGERFAQHAINRHGDVVYPCEWERARPWHARSHS